MTIVTKKEFIVLLEEVTQETKDLMVRFPEMMMYGAILKQLEAVYQVTVVENRNPTFAEYESTSLGAMALKNFEEGDTYAGKLKSISYHFEHFATLA